MFDVGFSELMLIAVVALVVIGPERLPGVARTVGHLFGRLQRYVNDVKSDISREIELDELKKFKNQFEEAAQSVESGVRAEVAGAETAFNSIAADLNPEVNPEVNPAVNPAVNPGLNPEVSSEVSPVEPVPTEAATSVPAEGAVVQVPAQGYAPMVPELASGATPAAIQRKTAA